jgi:colanic acid/amylovoran biosynthesis protein
MTTIHFTGLCLAGNKGGPAILFSCVTLLKKHIKPLKVIVESADIKRDLPWQDYYDVELVPRPKSAGRYDLPGYFKRRFTLYKDVNLVIDMHGVRFAGSKSIGTNLMSASTIILPRLRGIPVVSFTQTYGPFGNFITQLTAKITLNATNLLFAREPESVEILESIGLGEKCQLFPDVAMTLPAASTDELNCSAAVRDFIFSNSSYIGVSLSTKVIREEKRLGLSPRYETLMAEFIKWILEQGYRVLLIPHTHQPHKSNDDDLRLAIRVFDNHLKNFDSCLVVEDDLPPSELKALIAKSHIAIGSRYHSLIAALSTGVPALAIGWSHKYDGLLSLFDVKKFSMWADQVTLDELQQAFGNLVTQRDLYSKRIKEKLPEITERVERSIEQVAELI